MYLKNIALVNIGAYKGYNFFNFETEPNKNVLLIGGENGAGKTTLLNAIKLGLFGAYGFGYKTENNEYFKHVSSVLNKQAKREKLNDFNVTIQFSVVDNLEIFNYELKREWTYSNEQIKETYYLIENGHFLDEQQKMLFNAKLKDFMPPQLLDFCLFDGEEIAQIVTQNKLSSYIKKLSKVVFNLDLFEKLEADLENYSKQHVDSDKLNTIEHDLYKANTREKDLRTQIATTIRAIEYKSTELKQMSEEYLTVKDTFEKYGGLRKQEREELLLQINQIETDRKHRSEQIKQFVSSYLPFFLAQNLVQRTREQLKNEESLQLSKQLEEKLSTDILQSLLLQLNIEGSTVQAEQMKEQLVNLVKPAEQSEIIHGASFAESFKVEQAYNITQQDLPAKYLNLLNQNAMDLAISKQLRDKVKIHDTTDEFGQIIKEMDCYNANILQLTQALEAEQNTLAELKQELIALLEQIEKIKLQLRNYEKTSGSFLEAQKIIALSRKYQDIQITQRLQDIQIQATTNLKKMLHKHDYVSLIKINPDDYEVTLIDAHKNEIEKRTLSAGEKQILLISIIWAIFDCSGRQVPFIFDTLLGRLDKTHKSAVLKTFIPNFGKQTIILSTDSEIDQAHYKILEPAIAREYTLEFNSIQQQTSIKKDYFKFS
ncbi:DNA sulfur modification protein DndD [Lysinibacillus sp. KU-BSD001]|uniref:DNA sulfur modification protein DndD n=1 Tax=Lysinibacillus sp. KU-BSD001 TaxID=3141328 RepID=UPI0036EAA3A0